MKQKKKQSKLKTLYYKFKDFEHLIETTGHFMLILAFIIIIPYFAETQMVWFVALILFATAINITLKKFEEIFPQLKIEYEKDEFKKEIYDRIKDMEKEVKKLKDERKKEKQ